MESGTAKPSTMRSELKWRVERWVMLLLLVACFSCSGKRDPFFGRWTVEKVNVEFNEDLATPEMVRQYGELEKGNVIEISADSVLTLISDGDTLRGVCTLKGTKVYLDGKPFGRYENGILQTESNTPLGGILVIYKK